MGVVVITPAEHHVLVTLSTVDAMCGRDLIRRTGISGYVMLARMEDKGLIVGRPAHRDDARRVYRLAELGEKALSDNVVLIHGGILRRLAWIAVAVVALIGVTIALQGRRPRAADHRGDDVCGAVERQWSLAQSWRGEPARAAGAETMILVLTPIKAECDR